LVKNSNNNTYERPSSSEDTDEEEVVDAGRCEEVTKGRAESVPADTCADTSPTPHPLNSDDTKLKPADETKPRTSFYTGRFSFKREAPEPDDPNDLYYNPWLSPRKVKSNH